MDALLQDLRYALRTLARAPGFTAVAVITLALGIGANTAIFSVVNAVLLKPLEYRAPEELVFIHSQFPTLGFDEFWVSPPEYRDLQQHARSYSGIGAWRTGSASISGIETPIRVTAAVASHELFSTLGVAPQLGRAYTAEEDRPDAEPVVMVSHRLWQNAFGGDAGLVGRDLEVNGVRSTVVGVMPEGFDVEEAGIDLWRPLAIPALPTNRGSHSLNLVGRLAPGASVDRAREETAVLLSRWRELAGGAGHVPNDSTHPMVVKGLREEVVGEIRPALLVLLGAVGLVLLIACANVANLLLASAESRQREIAVRGALGAGRGRLVRQFLTESVILALAGGGLGLLLGYAGVKALLRVGAGSVPRAAGVGLDPAVLLFTLGVSLLTGLLFGLAPLMHLSQRAMGGALRDGGQRSSAGAGRKRLRRTLVVSEVALAVILVVGSGLLLRSFSALQETDPGFEPAGLLTFQLYLPPSTYPEGQDATRAVGELRARLAGLPGVTGVAAMTGMPPVRDVDANDTEFDGLEQSLDGPAHNVDYYQTVAGDYFATMGIPIVEGRGFEPSDDGGAAPVAVVNERLARVFYPDRDPIGQRLRPCCGDETPWLTIVGIAADVKQGGLSEETGTELYYNYPQTVAAGFTPREVNLVVRSTRPPLSMADEVRQAVWSVDRSLPVAEMRSMETHLAGSVSRPRFLAMLLAVFAGVALALAAVGTYGVLSYSVAERRKEIGIRVALGARTRSVMAMVLRDGLLVAGTGLVLGLAGALLLTRLLESLLYGVTRTDPLTFAAAPLVLSAVALAACYIPARRATRVDPVEALRAE